MQFLRQVNRKSHLLYLTMTLPMTLNDPNHPIKIVQISYIGHINYLLLGDKLPPNVHGQDHLNHCKI